MEWPRLLAYISGRVDKELLVRNEYLAAENRILRAKIKGRLRRLDGEKRTLAEIAHWLGRKALAEVAVAAKPGTILRWFRKLVARKFDGSARRQSVGRPRIEKTIEDLIVRMAQENRRGARIAWWERWPISDIAFPTRRLGMFCSAMALPRHHSASIRRAGATSFAPTWRCWPRPTSSRWKSLPARVWSRTTCFASSSWRHGTCAWPGSRRIRTRSGWSSR